MAVMRSHPRPLRPCLAQRHQGDSGPTLRQASAMPPREGGARGATGPNGCTDPWGHAANGPAPAPYGRGLVSPPIPGAQWRAWADGAPHRGAAVRIAFQRLHQGQSIDSSSFPCLFGGLSWGPTHSTPHPFLNNEYNVKGPKPGPFEKTSVFPQRERGQQVWAHEGFTVPKRGGGTNPPKSEQKSTPSLSGP